MLDNIQQENHINRFVKMGQVKLLNIPFNCGQRMLPGQVGDALVYLNHVNAALIQFLCHITGPASKV